MRPTVLVTGGAGYIGAHACKALSAAGFVPVVYDNLSTGHEAAVRWGPFERGDISDATRLDRVFAEHRPVAVMHFAASSEVGVSVREPLAYYRNNVAGSLTLIERMVANGVQRLVFSSTCATYGPPDALPITEAEPQTPINPYGHSKLMVERMLRDAADAAGLSSVALRYFNAAGADPEAMIGEEHDPETHLVPLVLHAARDPSRSIRVFGTDYPTPDGTCVRDYIHVDDLASAHVSALNRLLSSRLTGFTGLNLGTGTGFSVRDIIDVARRVTGATIDVIETERRSGDPAYLVADPTEAFATLDWRPIASDIEYIIQTAWNWMQREELRKLAVRIRREEAVSKEAGRATG